MKKLTKRVALSLVLVALILTPIMALNVSVVDNVAAASVGKWGDNCAPGGVPTDIRQAIMNITNWILGFVSMICVLVVIYGLVSGADTIKYGIVGLVVCGLAYAIVIVVSTVILG